MVKQQEPVIDKNRQIYKLFFPSDLKGEQVARFVNDTHGSMHRKTGLFNLTTPIPSLVYEVFGTSHSVTHWLKVPWAYRDDVIPPLQVHIPGMRPVLNGKLPEDERYEVCEFTVTMELGAKNSFRMFRVEDAYAVSAGILKRFEHLGEGEKLRLQWVVMPARPETKPVYGEAATKQFRYQSLYMGPQKASRDEVKDAADKLDEHNFYVALRIGAVANTDERAKHLIGLVVRAMRSTQGDSTFFGDRWWVRSRQHRIDAGSNPDPLNFFERPIKLNVSELTAFLAWRIEGLTVAGCPPFASKALPTPPNVRTTIGTKVGVSTYPGSEDREIAVPYAERTKHVYVSGGTGSGKTTLAGHSIAQDMHHNHGTIVIDGKGDMFYRALDGVPENQIPNTIVVDFSDLSYAAGFNLLQQGNHAVAIDELAFIINTLFGRESGSMWMVDVLTHALHTLAPSKDGTFMDAKALLLPRPQEKAWADHLKRTVPDPELREWWEEFAHDSQRDMKIQTLKNRIWPMMRSNLGNVFGQSQSTFSMRDVIQNHMNLFINLSGLEDMSKRLAGTIFTNAVWQAVQSNPVQWPNFMYVDEAQDIVQLMKDARDMLAKSRSFGLGLFLANQYIGQFDDGMRDAVISNVQTKFIMHSENPKDNNRLAASFGKLVSPEDFSGLGRFEVLARIATPEGTSAPLTLRTNPPLKENPDLRARVLAASRKRYARRVDEIAAEMETKRTSFVTTKTRSRPRISGSTD